MNDHFTVCRICDALLIDRRARHSMRVKCPRCGTRLRFTRDAAIDWLLALSVAVLPLMTIGLTASFLSLSGGGADKATSVLGTAAAVATGDLWPFSLLIGLLIVAVPTLRATALCYALLPVRTGHPPARHALAAFRLADRLRPWSMAEIFVIGVAVALVKVAGLASVTLGPAFWSFVLMGVLALLEDAVLCRRSVWDVIS